MKIQESKTRAKKKQAEELAGRWLSNRLIDALVTEDGLEPTTLLVSATLKHAFNKKEMANLMLAIAFLALFNSLKANATPIQLRELRQDLERLKNKASDSRFAQLQMMEQRLIEILYEKGLKETDKEIGKNEQGKDKPYQESRESLEARMKQAIVFFNQNISKRWHEAFTQLIVESLYLIGDYVSITEIESLLPFRVLVGIERLRGRPKEKRVKVEKELETAFRAVMKEGLKPIQSNVASFLPGVKEASELRRLLRRHDLKWPDVLRKYS
ncbi:MAG: hypothetical protein WBV94_28405 [Blastocatellia bacterium]